MNCEQDYEGLQAELVALREEVKGLKDMVSNLYLMMIDYGEDEDSPIHTGGYLN
ncbi:MAG TPA: hypothetical protein VJX93_00600 [Candidatus Methanomethylophilaceae archaeon]|jgi:hypothetical protein|nr:hypothetical protein [Candidatus Methanomethylophilaceae archaeon]